MAKKFSLLLAAIAVVAFAVPAFASAAAELTIDGAPAEEGDPVTGTSTDTVTTTSIGNLTCASVVVHAEVTENGAGTVKAKSSGAGTTATCFFKGTQPITIDDATLTALESTGPKTGSASLTFVATLPKELTCHYSGTVPGEYTSGTNKLSISGGLTASPEACGTASIAGSYTLSSSQGAVIVH